jgi:hypothetical protein
VQQRISPGPDRERLVVKLNPYAAATLQGVVGKPLQARMCRDEVDLQEQSADHSQLTFLLSPDAAIAKRQKACIEGAATLQKQCAEPR